MEKQERGRSRPDSFVPDAAATEHAAPLWDGARDRWDHIWFRIRNGVAGPLGCSGAQALPIFNLLLLLSRRPRRPAYLKPPVAVAVLTHVLYAPSTPIMALVVPAHRIQGVFGSPSWSSILPASGAASQSHEMSFNALPNASFSSVRNRAAAANLSYVAARTAFASVPVTPVVTRPRRSSIHGATTPVSNRRAPPPPPTVRTSVISVDDPFADRPIEPVYVVQPTPRSLTQSRMSTSFPRTQLASHTTSNYTYSSIAPQRAQRDAQRTARLVASVLLSRTNGRPMRKRCPSPTEEKVYVKSGLSQMIAVDA
ncbi:hypothetical protein BDW22DRAFT_1426739 [Trametopsis cervina]|nr:hypothetical protein BDW22DRAFT_1426739 [Trametopsis cervina]